MVKFHAILFLTLNLERLKPNYKQIMLVETNEFKCVNCGQHLYKHNAVTEQIKGYSSNEQVVNCSRCDAKYLIDGDNITQWANGKDLKESNNQDNKPSMMVYIIFGLIAVGAFCFIMDYFSKSNKVVSTTQQATAVTQASQPLPSNNCDFESARKKALDKVAKLNLSFVDDEFPADKNIDGCSIKFHFYVKKISYDLEGNSHLQDKVFELKLDYRKIGVDFEFIEGKLFEVNSSKYQVIN